MEMLSALQTLCGGDPPVTSGFPSDRGAVMQGLNVDACMNSWRTNSRVISCSDSHLPINNENHIGIDVLSCIHVATDLFNSLSQATSRWIIPAYEETTGDGSNPPGISTKGQYGRKGFMAGLYLLILLGLSLIVCHSLAQNTKFYI